MENLPETLLTVKKLWAIQLSNTEYRKWMHGGKISEIMFDWSDIKVPVFSTYNNLSISVAKQYTEKKNDKIKSIADGIYYSSRLKKGEGILGVDGERVIKKVGFISTVRLVSRYSIMVEIIVEWINEINEITTESKIFNTNSEIQKVTLTMLKNIRLPIRLPDKDKHLFRGGTFAGRVFDDLLMGDPFQNETWDLNCELHQQYVDNEEKYEKGGKIALFYGTNRNRTDSVDVNEFYGDDLSELKFGWCEVSIPKGHLQGEVERPLHFWILEFQEKEEKHIVLNGIAEKGEKAFLATLDYYIGELDEKTALIFIHGYNTTFAETARRTAQIAWDIPFNGVPGFFSWPSCGRPLAYLKDIEHADATVPYLEKFIEKIISETNIEKLHLIAHSMGNRILVFTLNKLSVKQTITEKLKIINQIVLAAPDIDQNVFKYTILPEFKNVGKRRTLYSSDKDQALHLSEDLRGGLPRLGDAGDSLFVVENIDTIDASNVKSDGNNHSYIFDEKELLTDLYYLLKNGFDPLNRRLRARKKNDLTYWLFPA